MLLRKVIQSYPHELYPKNTSIYYNPLQFDPEVNKTISMIVKLRNICHYILKAKREEFEEVSGGVMVVGSRWWGAWLGVVMGSQWLESY